MDKEWVFDRYRYGKLMAEGARVHERLSTKEGDMNGKRKPTPHRLLPSGPGGWSFCSCGAKTGPVGTFTKQRQWHRQHKRDARKRDGDE